MAFIRRKRTTAGYVYQVVQSIREGPRVRQKVLVSLGHWATIGACLAKADARIAQHERLHGIAAASRLPGSTAWLDQQLATDQALAARLRAIQAETGLP